MGSILRETKGVSKFKMPGKGVVVVIFNDRKTTPVKIVKALGKKGFTVKGKPVYVKLDALSPQYSLPGSSPSLQEKPSPDIGDQPPQGSPLQSTSQADADLPLRKETPKLK